MDSSSPARYPSDLTDEQWALIEPMVPVHSGGRAGGHPVRYPRRRIVDAILYVARTGCSWRQLPHDFPPWDTVFWYFKQWRVDGTVDRIHDALRDAVQDAQGRDPMASAGMWMPSRSGARTPCPRPAAGSTRPRKSTAASVTSW